MAVSLQTSGPSGLSTPAGISRHAQLPFGFRRRAAPGRSPIPGRYMAQGSDHLREGDVPGRTWERSFLRKPLRRPVMVARGNMEGVQGPIGSARGRLPTPGGISGVVVNDSTWATPPALHAPSIFAASLYPTTRPRGSAAEITKSGAARPPLSVAASPPARYMR